MLADRMPGVIDRFDAGWAADAISRRRLLATGGVLTAGLAGCLSKLEGDCQDCGGYYQMVDFAIAYESGATLDDNGEPWASTDRDGVVTVTHRSGNAVRAGALTIEGAGLTTRGDGEWYRQAAAEPGVADSSVTVGASARIEADPSFTLRLRWHSSDGDDSQVLAELDRTPTKTVE